jgi:two-component system, NarL family, sensor histidine kinase EvgS
MAEKSNPQSCCFLKSVMVVILMMVLIQTQPVSHAATRVQGKDASSHIRSSASHEDQGLSLTPEESAWLADHPEITIAVNEAWPPMDYMDTDGMPHGIGVGFIRALNARLGDRLKIIPLPWGEMVAAVTEKRIDALMDITPRPDREPFFNFTKPYLVVPHSVIARKDAPYYADLSSLKGKTVGVERQFFVAPVIREKYPAIQLTLFDTTSDALDAVSKGMIDAYVGNRAVAMFIMEREVIPNLKVHGKIKETSSINAIGVRKDRPILRDILQKALDDLDRSEISAILRKWVDLDEEAAPAIQLSPKETFWLNDHPEIAIAFDGDYAPYSFQNEKGEFVGIAVDMATELARRVGIRLKVFPDGVWDRLYAAARKREVDVVATLVPRPERREWFAFTKPYISIAQYVITRKGDADIRSREQIAGKTVALVKGYATTAQVLDEFPSVRPYEVATLTEALEAVSIGRADATVVGMGIAHHLISQEGFLNLTFAAPYAQGQSNESFGVRKDWPELVVILDKALDAMSEQKRIQIFQRWMIPAIARVEAVTGSAMALGLTDVERAWIEGDPVLRLGYDTDWPPVEYVDKEGKLVGMSADFMQKLSAIMGIEIRPIKAQGWETTLEGIREGSVDILFSTTRTPQRDSFLLFSEPYLRFPMVIVTDQGAPYIGDMTDLRGRKIAVVKGYASHDFLKTKHPELELLFVNDVSEGLNAVVRQKAYAFIDSLAAISHVIGREGIAGVKVSGETPYSFEISVAVSKDQPILAGIVQKALDSVSEEERNAIFQKWISVTCERKFDYRTLWKFLLAVVVIFGAVLYWNRRLSHEINLRRKVEGELVWAKEAAESANRVKSAFLASMSHELRTPLNSIIGFTGIVLNELAGPLNLEQKKQLKMVKGSSHHLLDLINDVLDISKIEAGEVEISKEEFSLRQVMDQVAASLRPLAEQKGLWLYLQMAPEVDSVVSDERRVRQVLINLVNNAVKFTEKGGVTIVCRQRDDQVEIAVTDTGIGIREEDMGRLFRPFQQLDTGTARRYEGTGLGLSVCRKILDMLGSTIRVDSQYGKGTTFAFTIPVNMPEEART